ncbi:MAG: hydrogenase maturation nickel metallochaperone HypA [Defluviitaleaceae bacterium]|nr:hydrogenase maturation nickel metallochaperone HypA [Defluviitaleaceae bacterium]
MIMFFYNPPLFIMGVIISYVILYVVVKAAVRNAIVEAREINETQNNDNQDDTNIAPVWCKHCGKKYDMDYPKCPHCG